MLWSHVYLQMDRYTFTRIHMSRIDVMEWQRIDLKVIVRLSDEVSQLLASSQCEDMQKNKNTNI